MSQVSFNLIIIYLEMTYYLQNDIMALFQEKGTVSWNICHKTQKLFNISIICVLHLVILCARIALYSVFFGNKDFNNISYFKDIVKFGWQMTYFFISLNRKKKICLYNKLFSIQDFVVLTAFYDDVENFTMALIIPWDTSNTGSVLKLTNLN